MIIKQREKSQKLKILEILAIRSELSSEDEITFQKQRKGYEGEVLFDELTANYLKDSVVINDFTFKVNGHTCQIDTLVVNDGRIAIYEIKNYEGRYRYISDRFILVANELELLDPLVQANRAQILMKQLLIQSKLNCSCESFAVFMHPNCTVYQDCPNDRVLLPSLFTYHFKKRSGPNKREFKQAVLFAEKLLTHNCEGLIYGELPKYTLTDLEKGIYCQSCNAAIRKLKGRTCICEKCQHLESGLDNAVRHILEKQLLFPEIPLRTLGCYNWCGGIHSKYRIRAALKKIEESKLVI